MEPLFAILGIGVLCGVPAWLLLRWLERNGHG